MPPPALRPVRRGALLTGPPTSEYGAALFDFDGTLADTGELNLAAVHHALTAHGVTVTAQWLRTTDLADLAQLRHALHQHCGQRLTCTDARFVDTARTYWARHADTIRTIAHVAAIARRAAETGPVAVVTANDGGIVRAGLTAIGLPHLATTLIAREHVPRIKPAPDAYLLAAARLGVTPAACLAYENTDEGITAARAAGIDVVDVRALPEPASKTDR
ncbi:HAD family phosphatase [Kitasatospora purpeofusca]|uniref:HAD family hydrolase n=1 Tax=Kitasatospora purpeofusca TaxID=67352 RepID=UPI002A5B0D85|nr:HAD family phosphatase [Kitasatospora purpeofusca]MDY0816075.1 HAD family phosphatase [Kitasatospora purpeofusca]